MFSMFRSLVREWRAIRRKRKFNRIKNKPLPCIPPTDPSDSLPTRLSFWKRRSQSHRASKCAPSPPSVTSANISQGADVGLARRLAGGSVRVEKPPSSESLESPPPGDGHVQSVGRPQVERCAPLGESEILRRIETSPGIKTNRLLLNYLNALRACKRNAAKASNLPCIHHSKVQTNEEVDRDPVLSLYNYGLSPCMSPSICSRTARYNVQFHLGAGATCHVMSAKVWHHIRERIMAVDLVAIKVFHKRQLAYYTHSSKANSTVVTAKCVAKERDILAAITENRSRYLTPLFESFQDEDNIYFVLKFYPRSLCELIGQVRDLGTRFTVGDVKFYASELLVAIEQLHSLNIAHRDIKPENILISANGHLALADFGLSVRIPPDDRRPFAKQRRYDAVGTPAYSPPELWDADVSKKGYLVAASDIWMYGAVVLQMWLSKRLPFFSPEGEDRGAMFDMNELVENRAAAGLLSDVLNTPEDLRPYISQIKRHEFFATINWDSVCDRFDDQERSPPYVPGDFLRYECYPSIGFSSFYRECSFSQLPSSDRETGLAEKLADFEELEIAYECPESDGRYYVALDLV